MLDQVLKLSWFNTTVYDIVTSRFSLFASLILTTQLEDELDNAQDAVTLFVPTNEAFGSNPSPYCLLDHDELSALRNLVLLHQVADSHPSATFTSSPLTLTSLHGSTLALQPASPPTLRELATQAKIVEIDILAYNGLVHALDTALLTKKLYEATMCLCTAEIDMSCELESDGVPCSNLYVADTTCSDAIDKLVFTYRPRKCDDPLH